jgi:hypothetical protein
MRRYCRVLLATAVFAAAGEASVHAADYGRLTCGNFLASGKDSMAVIIWWLRGYHAGKSGTTTFNPSSDGYAGRLGFYCRNHSADNLLETSERIFDQLDRGI